ncbi:MAG: hypothetical protein ACKV2V_14605 [Blastocatellia bacterium]
MLRFSLQNLHPRAFGYASLLLLLSGAAGQAPTSSKPDIRKIDFMNYTWRPDCLPDDKTGKPMTIRTKDGEYTTGTDTDRTYFKILGVAYGDLNSDGIEEAVVRTLCNTGGTGQFTDGILFTMRRGRPEQLTTLGMGDRADGGIHDVSIENGHLRVLRYGGKSGACCPDYIDTYVYKMIAGRLIAVGKPTRSDYRDQEGYRAVRRVQFARGTSATTLSGQTKGSDEYLLGASAGQIMNITGEGSNVTFELHAPDGSEMPPIRHGLQTTIRLPAAGDYRITINALNENGTYSIRISIH